MCVCVCLSFIVYAAAMVHLRWKRGSRHVPLVMWVEGENTHGDGSHWQICHRSSCSHLAWCCSTVCVCLCVMKYSEVIWMRYTYFTRIYDGGNLITVSRCVWMHVNEDVCGQNIPHLVSCVFYWKGACRWVEVCLLWRWLFVYLAASQAHLWECCHLAWGLEDPSIFNGVQTIPSWLFMHRFIHLLANSSFIHCFPQSVISKPRPICFLTLLPYLPLS